jgi:hypothetical protein
VVIERETLTIDLRPLATRQPAIVEVTYRLHNDGAAYTSELIFVSGSAVKPEDTQVQLDGQAIPCTTASLAELPLSWQPPRTTPAVGSLTADLPYQIKDNAKSSTLLSCRMTLPPGKHTLTTRYQTEASADSSGKAATRYWQLAYVLAPARDWGGFGGLEVTVHLPPGWRAASRPSLTRDGDQLRGAFDTVPDDSLALTIQAPGTGMALWPSWVFLGIWAGVGLAGMVACYWLGSRTGRRLGLRGRGSAWAWVMSVVAAAAWTGLLMAALQLWLSGWKDFAGPPQQLDGNAKESNNMSLALIGGFLSLATFPVGLAVAQVAAYAACNKARKSTVQPRGSDSSRDDLAEAARGG